MLLAAILLLFLVFNSPDFSCFGLTILNHIQPYSTIFNFFHHLANAKSHFKRRGTQEVQKQA